MLKAKNLLINIFVLVITLLLIFSLFEMFIIFSYPQPTFLREEQISSKIFEKSDYTPWKLKPGAKDRQISDYGNEFNVPLSINSDGLRDDEINHRDILTKKIIGAIGDSFTYGYGVRLEDTYHKKLEKMINKNLNDYLVINMGRADGSLSTDVQYLYLKRKGLKFNPKIIILGFYVGNDITDIGTKTEWTGIDKDGYPTNITTTYTYIDEKGRLRMSFERNNKNLSLFGRFNHFMSSWSHSYIFLKRLYIGAFLVKPEPDYLYDHPQDYLRNFDVSKKLLVGINSMLKSYNSTLVVILIPAKVQVSDKDWEAYERYFKANSYRFNPQKELIKFCSENNINCLDLLPSYMGKTDTYFKIDGHWNEKGHELAASELYKYLIAEKLI